MTEQRQHMENVMKELKSFGLSAKYAKDLESAWKKFTVWYSNNANTFKGGNTLLVHRTGEWHIHTGNWNKIMERKEWQLNAAFEYMMEKRQTFWDKKESGLSFCRLFRSSLKKQLEKQKLQYSLLAEKNVKVFFTCLKKSDADQRVHTHTRAHTHHG